MSAELAIRKNIDTILGVFERVKDQQGKRAIRFRCLVDRKTGEVCFIKEEQKGKIEGKNWRELHVSLFYDPSTKQVSLIEQSPAALDFDPKALRIFQETVQGIKRLESKEHCSVILADHVFMNRIWYPVERQAAERLLLKQPIGTYLVRKDQFAVLLEEQLLEQKVSLWTLSAITAHNKCSDYTLVYKENKWQIYNDDLTFHQRDFCSLNELIASHKQLFRYPLYIID